MKLGKLLQFLTCSALFASASTGFAQLTTYRWVGTTSNWATASNWVNENAGPLGTPPPTGGTIDARINVGAAGNLTPGVLNYTSAQGTTIFAPTNNRALVIANNAAAATTATVTISGGTFDSRGSQDLISNGNPGNSGTLNITGGTYTNVNAPTEIGRALVVGFTGGTGNLNISSGSAITGRIKFLVDDGTTNLNTTGNVALSGTGILETGGFARGTRTGTGGATLNFNISFNGGTLRAREDNADFMTSAVVNGNALVRAGGVAIDTNGFNIGISKALTQDAGSTGGGLTKSGAGTLTLSGLNTYTGTTNIDAGILQLDGSTGASSTANISTAGTLSGTGTINGNATLAGNGIINKSSGTIAGTLGVTGGNWNGNGAVTGLVTSSSGTFTIGSGANLTATSGVSATGGAMVVNGTLTGTLITTSNTTISGTGTITGDSSISGIHSPGNSPGIQSYSSNLSYTAGSSVTWELTADTLGLRGTDFDGINVGGNLDFSGATTINLDFDTAGSSVDWTDSFWDTSRTGTSGWLIYEVVGTTTNFSNLSVSVANWLDSSGASFDAARAGNTFSLYQDGQDIYLNYTVIPEPRSALLCSIGLLALLRRRRY